MTSIAIPQSKPSAPRAPLPTLPDPEQRETLPPGEPAWAVPPDYDLNILHDSNEGLPT